MPLLVILMAMGGFFASVFGFAKRRQELEDSYWQAGANALGMNFEGSGSMLVSTRLMTGNMRGVHVSIRPVQRGGENKQRYTQYSLTFPAVGPSVKMTKQGVGKSFGKLFGVINDVTIGSPAFDERVVIEGADPQALGAFMSPARQSVVLQLFEYYHFVTVTNSSIEVDVRGMVPSAQAMTATITHLVDMALVMSAPTEVDLALAKQQEGLLFEALDDLHTINDAFSGAGEPNSFTQLLEAEAAMATGDGAGAMRALEGVEEGGPLDVEGWRATAQTHMIPPMPPEPSRVVAHDSAPVVEFVGPDQARVIEDLLQSDRTGSDTEARFLDVYAGRVVRWSGTVDGVRPFRYDSDFDGEGIRATLTIGSLGDGVLITNRVQAVVGLPVGTEMRRGDDITVQGSLLRFDRYMRNFYLVDAEVIG